VAEGMVGAGHCWCLRSERGRGMHAGVVGVGTFGL
jgi:hypothetical protein